MRWALVRLIALWVPIASVLALALWAVLFDSFEPWTHPNVWTRVTDDLPPQLLFAATLLLVGRFETARWSGADKPSNSASTYWTLMAALILLGAAALGSIPTYEAQ